jgi:hypothetical protein
MLSQAGAADTGEDIQFELTPRICTLAASDKQCETEVRASWRSSHQISMCLVVVGRPEVRHCWDNVSEGSFTVKLVFTDDVTFQLKDFELQRVLASDVLRVIRESTRYRHKRREPWNVFD